MPKKDRIRISRKAMGEYAKALHRLGDIADQLVAGMVAAEFDHVFGANMPTGVDGLVKIGSFLGAALEGYSEHIAAEGIGGISGSLAEFRRLTKRLTREMESRVPNAADVEGDGVSAEAIKKTIPKRPKK